MGRAQCAKGGMVYMDGGLSDTHATALSFSSPRRPAVGQRLAYTLFVFPNVSDGVAHASLRMWQKTNLVDRLREREDSFNSTGSKTLFTNCVKENNC